MTSLCHLSDTQLGLSYDIGQDECLPYACSELCWGWGISLSDLNLHDWTMMDWNVDDEMNDSCHYNYNSSTNIVTARTAHTVNVCSAQMQSFVKKIIHTMHQHK